MGRRRFLIFAGAVAATTLLLVGVAFALTITELEPRANEWEGKTCTATLLASKKAKASEQIALCYAVAQAQEDRTKIAALEENQTSGPKTFTFFAKVKVEKGEEVHSPTISNAGYSTMAYSMSAEGAGNTISANLEVSNDKETWVKVGVPTSVCSGNTTTGVTCSVSGAFYRLSFSNSAASPTSETVTAIGQLAN